MTRNLKIILMLTSAAIGALFTIEAIRLIDAWGTKGKELAAYYLRLKARCDAVNWDWVRIDHRGARDQYICIPHVPDIVLHGKRKSE